MGCVSTITAEKFPKQGSLWGQQVRVCFHFDTSKVLLGRVVRDDVQAPHVTIIQLEDGRHVLSTECQVSPPDLAAQQRGES